MRKTIQLILCVLFVSTFLSFQANASENKGCIYKIIGKIMGSGPVSGSGVYIVGATCEGYKIIHKDGTVEIITESITKQEDASYDANDMQRARQAAKDAVLAEIKKKKEESCKNKGCEGK